MGSESICLTAMNSPLTYSGGRYHAWILAEALAEIGLDVTYWTNATPLVSQDFRDYPAHRRIKLHIDPFFSNPPPGHFNFGWMIPHQGDVWTFHRWLQFFTRHSDRRILLNFETPNWYAEAGQKEIDESRWIGWELASRCCEAVVSSLEFSSAYARKYFQRVASETQFLTLPPSINSVVADHCAGTARREKRIFLATRMNKGSSQHKGSHYAIDFLTEQFRGYEFVMLLGGAGRNKTFLAELNSRARQHDITLRVLRGVTDLQKFRWLSSCQASVFLSAFEGYGYPPIESLYCGTPCVAFDLPNYNETCGPGLTRIPQGDILQVLRRIQERDYTTSISQFTQAREVGSFSEFCRRTRRVLDRVATTTSLGGDWMAALAELSQHRAPNSLKDRVKGYVRSWIPVQAAPLKRLVEAFQ